MFEPKDLKNALNHAYKATATQQNRPVLTCVFFDTTKPNQITLVGADGYRLNYTTIEQGHTLTPFLLNRKDAKELANWIKLTGSHVRIYQHDNGTVSFEQYYKGRDTTKVYTTMPGKFPDWEAILPRYESPHTLVLTCAAIEMLATVFPMGMTLEQLPTGLCATYERGEKPIFKTHMEIDDTSTMPTGHTLSFNPQYVLDAIDTHPFVNIEFKNPTAPIIVNNGKHSKAVIMPINYRK